MKSLERVYTWAKVGFAFHVIIWSTYVWIWLREAVIFRRHDARLNWLVLFFSGLSVLWILMLCWMKKVIRHEQP